MISWLAYWLVRLLSLTLRYRLEDQSGLIDPESKKVFLFVFWHNRMSLMPRLYKKYLHREKVAILVSASRDGEMLSGVLARFGFTPVRGSTSRFGRAALLELSRLVADGNDAAITPDGPRGPRYKVQSGIIDLAILTGQPILPVSVVYSRKWELKSWDRFQIPIPFCLCRVRVGKPLVVARDADETMQEAKRKELETVLVQISKPQS